MPSDQGQTPPGPGIFRPEALEHRATQRGPGDVVRVAPAWTGVAFYVLIVVFAVAVVAAASVEIDRYVPGITAIDGGHVVVLLPASQAAEVPSGATVDLGAEDATVTVSAGEVLSPAAVTERYGVEVQAPSIAVVTSADGSTSGGVARVLVEREPMLVALIPGLKSLLGDDDA